MLGEVLLWFCPFGVLRLIKLIMKEIASLAMNGMILGHRISE
jgi:hypothetical protein